MLSLFGISEAEFEYHLKREFNDEEKFVLNYFRFLHSMFAHLYNIRNLFYILGKTISIIQDKKIHFEVSLKHLDREVFIGNCSIKTV